jgi:hypothetical protein
VGLILDSSVLIAAERSKQPINFLLTRIAATRPQRIMNSAVSVVELEHGFWRAQTPEQVYVRHFEMIPGLIVDQL